MRADGDRGPSRRLLLAGGAAALALVPRFGARAEAPTKISVALEWVPNIEFAGSWIALDRGYFAQANLDVSHVPGGPNATPPLVMLSAGKVTIAQASWMPFLDAVAKGNDFVILGALFPTTPIGILSMPKRPILKPADLVDAKILIQNDIARVVIESILKLNKLPPRFTTSPTGFSPEPLLAGDGDGYFCFVTNQPITFEVMGLHAEKDFYVRGLGDFGYRVPEVVMVVRRDVLKTQRPQLVAYLKALLRGWDENAQDLTVAPKLVVEKYGADLGLDLKQQTRQNVLQTPLTRLPGAKARFWMDPDQITAMIEIARLTGRTDLPDPAKVIDLSLLDEAQASL